METANKKQLVDDPPVFTLTRRELRQIIVEAMNEAVRSPGEDKLVDVPQACAFLN